MKQRAARYRCDACDSRFDVDTRVDPPHVRLADQNRDENGNIEEFHSLRGRDSRSEFVPFAVFLIVLLAIAGLNAGERWAGGLFAFTVIFWIGYLPTLWRRHHDAGWSGWWVLLGLIPGVAVVQLIVMCFVPTQQRSNRYGRVPKSAAPRRRCPHCAAKLREAVNFCSACGNDVRAER